MKQLITVLLILSASICQAQRTYPSSYYNVVLDGKNDVTYRDVKVYWKNDDASNIDNIDAIAYPGGYVIVKNDIKPYEKLDDGSPVFYTYVKDEGGKGVDLLITRYSERSLGFIIYYSKRLFYSMKIDLYDIKID